MEDNRRANLPRSGTYRTLRPRVAAGDVATAGGLRAAVSRRGFLRIGGVAILIGLGLSGGAELSLGEAKQFGAWPESLAAGVRALPPSGPRPSPAAWETRRKPAELPVGGGAVKRLKVPSVGIAADTVVLSVDPDGTLQRPPDPGSVGWYDFSGTPDSSTNVVFAGHVSWHTGEPAAFRRLREIAEGAEVFVTDAADRRFAYRVFASFDVEPEGSHVAALVGPQPQPVVTLISCDGEFDLARRGYTRRRLVQAALVDSS